MRKIDIHSQIRSNAGFTLAELMVVVGVAAIALLALVALSTITSKNEHSSETTMSRDAILSMLITASSNNSALTRSFKHMSDNPGGAENGGAAKITAVLNCLCGPGVCTPVGVAPVFTNSVVAFPFSLYAGRGAVYPRPATVPTVPAGEAPLSGTCYDANQAPCACGTAGCVTSKQACYDFKGAPCSPCTLPTCVYQATTSLGFQCITAFAPGSYKPQTTCNGPAEVMKVNITVSPISLTSTMKSISASSTIDLSTLYTIAGTCPW